MMKAKKNIAMVKKNIEKQSAWSNPLQQRNDEKESENVISKNKRTKTQINGIFFGVCLPSASIFK